MKQFIIGMISMIMLVGCTTSNHDSISEIRAGGKETFWPGLTYDVRQDDVILFSDLEKELQNNNMNLIKDTHPDALTGQYNLEDDDRISITILVDEFTSPDHQFVSDIFIAPRNNYMQLSQHPAVKVIASLMGEEQLLTWVADQEGEMTKASKDNENIQVVLAMDRCYLSFEYSPGSDTRRLDFRWAFKPHISSAFEDIAQQLEAHGMLMTGYIAGADGETLIATNRDYYLLNRMGHFRGEKIPVDVDQTASYQVMHDTDNPGSYSVQLYGHMRSDLSYPTQVKGMPGLDEITQLMNMDQETFVAITDEINKELTEAKRIRNKNYKGEYYVEGVVGEYHYIITVPQGVEVYNFTVLMEKI